MKRASLKTAILATALFGSAAAPFASAFADTAQNQPNNATVATVSTGIYDLADRYKDATGRPLPGWQYVIFAANGNG